ncbi:uncharacterized protein LOC109494219 [Felis catus]|uniref:uncharacterized protein LOC109494219 n=1 Tax=Felis catus TaxID=9685 RepID=UPI001D1A1CE4|nr:uncharacterized protein LOC109494219 [Felis catus]
MCYFCNKENRHLPEEEPGTQRRREAALCPGPSHALARSLAHLLRVWEAQLPSSKMGMFAQETLKTQNATREGGRDVGRGLTNEGQVSGPVGPPRKRMRMRTAPARKSLPGFRASPAGRKETLRPAVERGAVNGSCRIPAWNLAPRVSADPHPAPRSPFPAPAGRAAPAACLLRPRGLCCPLAARARSADLGANAASGKQERACRREGGFGGGLVLRTVERRWVRKGLRKGPSPA